MTGRAVFRVSGARARTAQAGACLAVAALLEFGAFAGAPAARAEPRDNAVPSCYDALREVSPRTSAGDLTVVIDQTAYLDTRMRQIVRETVERLIEPGVKVTIATFSAYVHGRYLDVLVSGQAEAPIDGAQRDFVSKRDLRQNDECLKDQLLFARRLFAKGLDRAFAGIDPSVERSDILAALRDLSRRVGESRAQSRMIVLVSDMLENSSITSFYQGNRLRSVDADAELKRVTAAGIKADFHDARVVVIGAGGITNSGAGSVSYRDPRALLALEEFWQRWFAASHAELVEFGKPTPLVQVGWDQAAIRP